jgi:hypothetical protein
LLFSTPSFADSTSPSAISLPNLSTLTGQSTSAAISTSADTSAHPTISNTGSTVASVKQTIPVITGGATATGGGGLGTNAPKLPNNSPSYPPASVPPTQDAPFMQVSTLPEGTVFIAVGAFLGFMALAVLLWRGLIVWSIHISVKRAAMQQNMTDTKAQFRTPSAPIYKFSDRESTLSLANLTGTGKGSKKGGRPSTAGHGSGPTQSLFFSPTAGAGASLANPGNRGSNYLPAGYYAAGAAAPGGGSGMSHIGSGSRENISLSNLRPQSQGYSRAHGLGPSPPDSPAFPAMHAVPIHGANPSTSTLDLNPRTATPRAPSAYLEDLFDEAGGPPPGHGPGGRF